MIGLQVRIAAAAAKTNRDGRALLGVAAAYLARAFAVLPQITNWADTQDNARELLDRSNLYAQSVYATIPDDDGPLSDARRAQVLEALSEADTNLALVVSVDANLRIDWLDELAGVIPAGIAAISTAAVGTALEHWVLTLVLIGVGLVVLLGWRRTAGMVGA